MKILRLVLADVGGSGPWSECLSEAASNPPLNAPHEKPAQSCRLLRELYSGNCQ